MALARPVSWLAQEVDRDKLSSLSKNSLGSTLTVFNVAADAQKELLALAAGKVVPAMPDDTVSDAEVIDDP